LDIIDDMKIMKVRRLGNSNVVTIPHELEAKGYVLGSTVLIETLDDGTLHIVPTEHLHGRVSEIGRQIVAENREALGVLASHDQGSATA
jgi:antitoxin component of MazEF toxin-antitoxin module